MLARDATSSPSSPSAANARTSASCRERRRSGAMAGLEIADQALESQPIALGAEPRHHAHRGIREHRAPSLGLSGEQVGQVYFDERQAYREQRVAYGETRVRVRRGVDDQPVRLALQPLDRVDQLTLVIRLGPGHVDAER